MQILFLKFFNKNFILKVFTIKIPGYKNIFYFVIELKTIFMKIATPTYI